MSEGPRFKVIGLVVGIAVVALAAGFFLLSGGQSSSSAASTHTVIPLSQRTHAKKAKAKHAKPAVKPAKTKPKPKPKPKAKAPKPPVTAQQDGLPLALTAALARNRIVVVALYAPKVELDDMALQEAKAGAADAAAGFVAVNVMSEAESRQLTKQLGVLEDPAVLVFKRPGDLVTRFSGFADKQTIFQAARNAGL